MFLFGCYVTRRAPCLPPGRTNHNWRKNELKNVCSCLVSAEMIRCYFWGRDRNISSLNLDSIHNNSLLVITYHTSTCLKWVSSLYVLKCIFDKVSNDKFCTYWQVNILLLFYLFFKYNQISSIRLLNACPVNLLKCAFIHSYFVIYSWSRMTTQPDKAKE